VPRRLPPPGFPDDLPEGKTLADLPDDEVQERAEVLAGMFDWLRGNVEKFVAAGCPAEDEEEFRQRITACLDYYVAAFRGVHEWREAREEAIRAAVEQHAQRGAPDDAPAVLNAAVWCEVALEAEESFWAAIRDHEGELRESGRWAEKLRRVRAH